MKKLTVLCSLLSVLACGALTTGCSGSSVVGDYTVTMSSGDYYNTQAVKDYISTHGMSGQLASLWSTPMFWNMLTPGIATGEDMEMEFLTTGGVSNYYTASLNLADDNSYTLTKKIDVTTLDEEGSLAAGLGFAADGEDPVIQLDFKGEYEADGSSVTLKVPTSLVVNVVTVGSDGMAQYFPFQGNFYNESLTSDDMDDLVYPGKFFYYFDGLYFTESDDVADMTVTVDSESSTFSVAD